MEDQIVSAVEIAWNPSSDANLHEQATEFCNNIRNDFSAWQPCLSIFTKIPLYSEVVRVFALDILSTALQQPQALDPATLSLVRDRLLQYTRSQYLESNSLTPDPPSIQNKLAQTFTDTFAALYSQQWPSFFDDILSFTSQDRSSIGGDASGTIFYLRVLNSIHEKIGDQMIRRTEADYDRANLLKDLIRETAASKVAQSWQDILSSWQETNDTVALLCLQAIARWVRWIDISLVVNQPMMEVLLTQLSRAQKVELRQGEDMVRDAAIEVFTAIIAKKMKSQDKLDVISFTNLEGIISQLIQCPPLNEKRFTFQYDMDLAENVAKLVNGVVQDIVRILVSEPPNSTSWEKAELVLQSLMPHLLRFFSDEYDEVCSTVIPGLTDILSFLKKTKVQGSSPERTVILLPILKALFIKMRYDETSTWSDEGDDTDEAEFDYLRKRLNTLQQSVAAVDEKLCVDAVGSLVSQAFDNATTGGNLNWRELELALYEILSFGHLAVKSTILYTKGQPVSPAAGVLVQMIRRMVESDIRLFSHPTSQLQYMEISVRYSSFFENNTQYINPVLQNFLQFMHHPSKKVKYRAWYLFHRFARQNRPRLGNVAQGVIQSVSDLLLIQAEIEEDEGEEEADYLSSVDNANTANSASSSQLFLFEGLGCVCSAGSVPVDQQVICIQAIMNPLFADIERDLEAAKAADPKAIRQLHDDVTALGTFARGFSDWSPSPAAQNSAPKFVPPVQAAFSRAAEATLTVLKSLKSRFEIRTAARFALSRFLALLDAQSLAQLPEWIDGLLTGSASKEEMTLFLKLLEQIIFRFRGESAPILDGLFAGLLTGIIASISAPITGTDDTIQQTELKQSYLSFIVVIVSNDLGSVLVSSANQSHFETLISTIEHFAKDGTDAATAKVAFQALVRMCVTWGGPDIIPPTPVDTASLTPQPSLPGFDQFMMTRFSPLCWAIPTSPTFNPKDAQIRQVLAEAAALQKTVYKKTGQQYVVWLRDTELKQLGMGVDMINNYLDGLMRLELKAFKPFFQNFIAKGGAA